MRTDKYRARAFGLLVPDDGLPLHPLTRERALGLRRDGSPIWPVSGSADQYWVTPVPPFHSALGASFGTFTTFQDVSPTPHPLIYGNQFRIQSKIELEAWGRFSTTVTPTLQLGFYFGTAATILAASSAITTASGAAAFMWHLKYCGIVTAVGATGSITGSGILDLGTALTTMSTTPIPVTDAARTVAIDTTVNKELGVGAAYSASSASNTVQVLDFRAMLIN